MKGRSKNVMEKLSLLLSISRVMCLLPYSQLEPARLRLSSSAVSRAASVTLFLAGVCCYCVYFYTTLNTYFNEKQRRDAIWRHRYESQLILQSIEISTSLILLLFTVTSCHVVEDVMRSLHHADSVLWTNNSATWLNAFICLDIILVITSMYFVVQFRAAMSVPFKILSTLMPNTLIFMEQLVVVVSHEISLRFQHINVKLTQAPTSKQVRRLRIAYSSVCDAQSCWASSLRKFLLLDMAKLFARNLFDVLRIITLADLESALVFAFVSFKFVLQISLLTWSCGNVAAKAQEIKGSVQRLKKRDLDASAAREIKIFIAQTQACQNTFTACGLFSVDLPLLFTMAGAVTSYLFVIIQLK